MKKFKFQYAIKEIKLKKKIERNNTPANVYPTLECIIFELK